MRGLVTIAVLVLATTAFAKNRDPKDYPQAAKVVSFERQPCFRQVGGITRVCHVITFEVDGQVLTGSCFRCDPLMPGETYPARLDRKDLVLYVIHQKEKGNWGQDNYSIVQFGK
jgi:hypothetical protein